MKTVLSNESWRVLNLSSEETYSQKDTLEDLNDFEWILYRKKTWRHKYSLKESTFLLRVLNGSKGPRRQKDT